jgi:hypothetical protein
MRRKPFILALAGIATTLAVVVGVFFLRADGMRGTTTRQIDGPLVGSTWLLSTVRSGGAAPIDIPVALRATLRFAPTGRFLSFDSLNTYGGTYVLTSSGYKTSDVAGTLVGFSGSDPVRLAAIKAIGSASYAPAQLAAQVIGDTLTISTPISTLTFLRDGPIPAHDLETPTRPASTK